MKNILQTIATVFSVCNGKCNAHLSPEAVFICNIIIIVAEFLLQDLNCLHNFMVYYMCGFVLLAK